MKKLIVSAFLLLTILSSTVVFAYTVDPRLATYPGPEPQIVKSIVVCEKDQIFENVNSSLNQDLYQIIEQGFGWSNLVSPYNHIYTFNDEAHTKHILFVNVSQPTVSDSGNGITVCVTLTRN